MQSTAADDLRPLDEDVGLAVEGVDQVVAGQVVARRVRAPAEVAWAVGPPE